MMVSRIVALVGVVAALGGIAHAQVIGPDFAAAYTLTDLGSVGALPPLYGGLDFLPGDPNTIIIGGTANEAPGAFYSVGVVRDIDGHITGFSGDATFFADGAFNDGGVVFGPGGVLFASRWPSNELGQTKPGSTITDKIIDLVPFGVASSHAALNFVPFGYPGAGKMKLSSWSGGQWYDAEIAPDGMGTYDLTSVTRIDAITVPGGPEGFTYAPLGSPLLFGPSMVLSEFSDGNVVVYSMDANGDPIIASRRVFVSGLEGAEGAVIDPLTGDFLFSTFGGGDHLVRVSGFAVPSPGFAGLASLALAAGARRRR